MHETRSDVPVAASPEALAAQFQRYVELTQLATLAELAQAGSSEDPTTRVRIGHQPVGLTIQTSRG